MEDVKGCLALFALFCFLPTIFSASKCLYILSLAVFRNLCTIFKVLAVKEVSCCKFEIDWVAINLQIVKFMCVIINQFQTGATVNICFTILFIVIYKHIVAWNKQIKKISINKGMINGLGNIFYIIKFVFTAT